MTHESHPEPHQNLLAGSSAGPAATRLAIDPAAALLAGGADLVAVLADRPTSSLGWALLAEAALAADTPADTLAGYAYARTGYHRGLDSLRRAGWRGAGPVPWEHEPNRGFLRALWALAQAAGRIGETDELGRCTQFLRDSSETAYQTLATA